MKITRIDGANPQFVGNAVKEALKEAGYDSYVDVKGSMVNLSYIRLSSDYIQKYGRNVSPYTGRHGNVLGWGNWVEVNNIINKTLDKMGVSANVSSQHGKLKIREGTHAFTERDWEEWGERNVGSIMNPIRARDAWIPENPEKARKKLKELW